MRKIIPALLSLLLLLSVASGPAAASSPFLAAPAARSLLINLVDAGGRPLKNAVVHLLTPGLSTIKVARTNDAGQATLQMPDGFSFWLRVWAEGQALIERPYVPASDGPVLTLTATPYTASLAGLIADDQGLPVPQARVSLFRDGYGLEARATTNELGLYRFENIRADGTYTLQVEAAGFRPLSQAVNPLDPNAQNQLDLSLVPGFGVVTGEVVDSDSRPISGVVVELLLNGWGLVERATTDGMGYFYLTAPPVENGAYQLRLSRPDYEYATSPTFSLQPGGWTDFSGGDRLTLNRLYAAISGKVVDQGNNALANIEVHLQRQDVGTVTVAQTDQQGRFRFTQVTGGTYRVRAFPNGDWSRSASEWLTVSGGQDLTVDVTAGSPNRTSYGYDSISGTVRNHLGAPVPGATVTVTRGVDSYTAQTDEEGRYEVEVEATIPADPEPEDEPATGYHVMVTATGYLTNDQPQADGQALPSLVTVTDDADNRADFTLQPHKGTVAGRVLNDRGRGLVGVKVGLLQEGRSVVAETTTDEAGRYEFPNLPVAKQGRYIPVVMDPAYLEASVAPNGAPVEPTALSTANPVGVILVARPAHTLIQGLVLAGDSRPAAKAVVTVARPVDGEAFTAQVRPDGSYQVQVPARAGEEYLVRAEIEGAPVNAGTAVTAPGTAFGTRVNLTLHPTAAITGRVFGPDGKPVRGVKVLLHAEGSQVTARETVTDGSGRYSFTELTPGRRYAVLAVDGMGQPNGLAPGELIITPLVALPSGETEWADLKIDVVPAAANP
ncbi:MAG: carboxypeptidase regulatory-like domain-containing protein [Bacillota bacterium]